MSLKSVFIEKLFREYDIKINLESKCNILVGANGVGKSTTLHILQGIFDLDFISISKYPFSSIRLVEDGGDIAFSRKSLFPTPEFMRQRIEKYLRDICLDIDDTDAPRDLKYCIDDCNIFLDFIVSRDIYCDYISNLSHGIKHSTILSKKIRQVNSAIYSYNIYPDIETIFKDIVEECKPTEPIHYQRYLRYYYKSEFENMAGTWRQKEYGDSRLIDLVYHYEMINAPADKPSLESATLNALSGLREKAASHLWDITTNSHIGINENYLKINGGKVAEFLKQTYLNVSDFAFPVNDARRLLVSSADISEKPYYPFLSSVLKDKKIDINQLINRYYYDADFLKAFNKRALEASADVIGINKQELMQETQAELAAFYQNPKVIDSIENYFRPCIVANSLFDMDFELLRKDAEFRAGYIRSITFDQRHVAFRDFFNREEAILRDKNNRSKKVSVFEELLCDYLAIKSIEICPSGLVLRNPLCERKQAGKLAVLSTHENLIDLAVISSGEKKIILMLALAVFTDNITLMFDEPELSLSLVWQEQLIPDILEHTQANRIIVSTHSPYIANDESLTDYITYLPFDWEGRNDKQ